VGAFADKEMNMNNNNDVLCGFCGANVKTEDCPNDCPSWDNLSSVDCVSDTELVDVQGAITEKVERRLRLFKERTNRYPTVQETNDITIVAAYEVGKGE
jgi:hypothetical protein